MGMTDRHLFFGDDVPQTEEAEEYYNYGYAAGFDAGHKMGKWIDVKTRGGKTRTLICPFCKWKSGKYTWESYNYCPYCGAELEADNDDTESN